MAPSPHDSIVKLAVSIRLSEMPCSPSFAIFRHIGMVVTGVTPEELQQAVTESAPMTESAEMTIAEILHQRGFEKGEASGATRRSSGAP